MDKIKPAVSNEFYFRDDRPPLGRKILLLTWQGICVIGKWEDGLYAGWQYLPRETPAIKRARCERFGI